MRSTREVACVAGRGGEVKKEGPLMGLGTKNLSKTNYSFMYLLKSIRHAT